MSITPLPTPPNRTDAPALFTARANAFVDALAAMVAQFNAMLPWLSTTRQNFAPTSGGTVTIAPSSARVIEVYINNAASIAGLTVNFPTLLDGQRLFLFWLEPVSSITLAPANGTLRNGFLSVGANARSAWVYNAASGYLHRYG